MKIKQTSDRASDPIGNRRRDLRLSAPACAVAIVAGVSLLGASHAGAEEGEQKGAVATGAPKAVEVAAPSRGEAPREALPPAPALPGDAPAASRAAPPVEEPVETLGAVVVRARNRTEKLQDVPVPVSVIGSKELERDNAVTVTDFTKKVPNLLFNGPNARQSSLSIRGLGKNSANDSMEASVGVIVDNVVAGHVGMSWGDYVDIDHVEVLRGPQGTLLGKNTTLGVLNVVTKLPSFTPQSTFKATVGSRNAVQGKASASGPLVDGALAYRASFYVNKRDGSLENLYQSGETWLETNRLGGRVQLLLLPTDTVSTRIILDHAQSSERINIDPYQVEPTTFADGAARTTTWSRRLARSHFGGYTPLLGSKDKIDTNDARPLESRQNGESVEINWNLPGLTLTSITAHRSLDFDAKNDSDQTRFSINRGGTLLATEQVTQEFRLTSPTTGAVDYQLGVFGLRSEVSSTSRTLYGEDAGAFYARNSEYATLSATPSGQLLLRDALKGVSVTTETRPETTSLAGFGQLNWRVTDKATLTLGVRETREEKTNDIDKRLPVAGKALTAAAYPDATAAELAAANAVRNGQIGTVYGFRPGDDLTQNSLGWLFSPSYKPSENVLLYASAGHGEKSGAVQFNSSNGTPQNVNPEKVLDFEVGFKSTLFNRRLVLNTNLYHTRVQDYQANLTVFDPAVNANRSFLGNVGEVRARGVEVDGAFSPLSGLRFTFSGAYNDAIYASYTNAPCPPERANAQAICDFTGRRLAAAPRYSGNLGFDFQTPVGGGLIGRLFLNNTYRSGANVNAGLSDYGWQEAYSITDGGIGVSSRDGKYEFGLVAKNIFDTIYATSIGNFSSTGAVGYTLGERRFVGATFRAKL